MTGASLHGLPVPPGPVSASFEPQAGHVTAAFVATTGLTLAALVVLANVLVLHYAQGVLHSAAEQGAREGAATGSAMACEARATRVLDRGLGSLGDGMDQPSCTVGPNGVTVDLSGTFDGWTPLLPTTQRRATARIHATVERP